MCKQLARVSLIVLLVALGYLSSVLAQVEQITHGSPLVVPLHSIVSVRTLPPLSAAAPSGTPSAIPRRFRTPDPEGLRLWKDFLRKNPDALKTAPGVVTQGPPNALVAPSPASPSSRMSDLAAPFLFPDPRGLQMWQDYLREHPNAVPMATGISTSTASQVPPNAPASSSPSSEHQFDGLSNADNIPFNVYDHPPDPNLGVGPGHVFQMVNHAGRITYKDGSRVPSAPDDFALSDFFWLEPEFFGVDPRIIYDAQSGRWFGTYLQFNADPEVRKSSIMLAVSTTSDPTDDFCLWQLGNPTYEDFIQDFPHIGVSSNKVAVSYNGVGFTGNWEGAGVYVIDKAELTALPCSPSASGWRYQPMREFVTLQPAQSLSGTNDIYMATWAGISEEYSILEVVRLSGLPPDLIWATTFRDIRTLHAPPDAHQKDSDVLLDTGWPIS